MAFISVMTMELERSWILDRCQGWSQQVCFCDESNGGLKDDLVTGLSN